MAKKYRNHTLENRLYLSRRLKGGWRSGGPGTIGDSEGRLELRCRGPRDFASKYCKTAGGPAIRGLQGLLVSNALRNSGIFFDL